MQRERVQSKPSPLRCPFCHESVDLDAEELVVCEGCLARHHAACWGESSGCSACQATTGLTSGQAVGEPVQEAESGVVRLIHAHEHESRGGGVESYLLSPVTLGLYPLVRAELRLLEHVRATRPQLRDDLPPDARERVARYQTEGFAEVERGAALRIRTTACIFVLALFAAAIGLGHLSSHYTPEQVLGLRILVGALVAWVTTILVALARHRRAVRRHDSRQLYSSLLANQTAEEDAQAALATHEADWSRDELALKTVASMIFAPLFPFWIATASRLSMDLHESREESADMHSSQK